MENPALSKSPWNIFWSELGKWQALMVFMTNMAYLFSLKFVNNKLSAAGIVTVLIFYTACNTQLSQYLFFIAICISGMASIFFIALIIGLSAKNLLATIIIALLVIIICIAISYNLISNHIKNSSLGINKKIFYLSYFGQFILILSPMLII